MKYGFVYCFLTLILAACQFNSQPNTKNMNTQESPLFFKEIADYTSRLESKFATIPAERKEELANLAAFIDTQLVQQKIPKIIFICTHNSRRSHFGQFWASVAAHYYGIPQVENYSGGTEVTAFNPRSVAALQRAGFQITKIDSSSDSSNPRYAVTFMENQQPLIGFSKKFGEDPNPKEGFCAVMTCSHADQNCPLVLGAIERIPLPYDDPKAFDNTPEETAKYDERCLQIATEMFYAFSLVKKK
jgi:hypothetical protein